MAFAKVFDVPVSDLIEAATFTGREPFAPDPSADRLTPPQRAVLNELIRVMTDANEKVGDGSERSATPITRAGVSPAPTDEYLLGLAANRPGESELQRQDREASERGEESQDE